MTAAAAQIVKQLREAKGALQAEFPLTRLALFGSYARGTQIPHVSDVDILVEVEPSIGLGFVTLAERLEALLGERVDLVSRRAIKPSLWEQIEPELIDAWSSRRLASLFLSSVDPAEKVTRRRGFLYPSRGKPGIVAGAHESPDFRHARFTLW